MSTEGLPGPMAPSPHPHLRLLVGIALDLPLMMLPTLLFNAAVNYTAWSAWWF